MPGYLPPVIIDVIGTDKDLLATLAEARAALAAFAATPTEAKITVDANGLSVAMVRAINEALANWQSPIDRTLAEMRAKIESETWYAGVGVEVREAEVAATLASLDATIAKAKSDILLQALGGGGEGGVGTLALAGGAGDQGGAGGGLLAALGWGKGALGMAGFGSILSLMGFGAEHVAATGVGIGGSMMGAGLGAGFLGLGALGTGAVGMGTNMAGTGQAMNDIKLYRTALNSLKTAIATYGANSAMAAQAQQHLNYVLSTFPKQAQGSIVNLSNALTKLGTIFDKFTGQAEAKAAGIFTQLVHEAEKFIPTIGKFASQNMTIIQKALQPLLHWLSGPGLKIFTNLEKVFQGHLPTAMHAFVQGFELLAKTITISSKYLGHFINWINQFLTRMNGATFGKWAHFVRDMIGLFEDWFPLLIQVGKTLLALFQPAVGLGGQFAKLLTTILRQIDAWLSSAHMKTVLHQLFSVHLIEIITGIGGVLKATLPFIEAFATAFIHVITVGAELANMILLPLAQLLSAIARIPFAAQLLGWAAAGLILVSAFNKLRVFIGTLAVKLADFNAGTWLSNLGLQADEDITTFDGLANAMRTGVTQAFQDAGLVAEGAGVQITTMGDEAVVAGTEAADAGAAGAAGMAGMLGPIGIGITMVGMLAMQFLHFGKSAITAQKVAQSVQQLNQQLGSMPTTGLAQMNTYLNRITTAMAAVVKQFDNLQPGSQGAADASAKVQDLTTKSIAAARGMAQFTGNVSALGTAFGLSKQQVVQFAQTAGINLTKALNPALLKSFVLAMQSTTSNAFTLAKTKARGFSAQVLADAKKLTATAKNTYPQLSHYAQMAMIAEGSIFTKTGLRNVVDLVNATKGGLPVFTAVLHSMGVTLPKKTMALLGESLTKGGHISIDKLAYAMAAERPKLFAAGRAARAVVTQSLVKSLEHHLRQGGKTAMVKLADAMRSEKTHVSTTAADNALAAAKAVANHQKDFSDGGRSLMTKMAEGILAGKTAVVSAAVQVAQAAVAAADATMASGMGGSSLPHINSRLNAGAARR